MYQVRVEDVNPSRQDPCDLDNLVAPGNMHNMVPGGTREKGTSEKGTGRDRKSQLLHGVLDMCLLSIIDEEASYGYEMVKKLSDRGLQLASEGSIYPLLSRLQKQGLIEGYLVQSSEGPARKYYRMSLQGREALARWRGDWETFRDAVDVVMNGPANE